MNRSKGRTLIEIMVASALLLLLTGLMLRVLTTSRQRLQRIEALINLEEQAVKAMAMVSSDLSEAHLHTVETPSSSFLVFSSPRSLSGKFVVAPSGELRWSTVVCYRKETIGGDDKLIRQVEDMPDVDGESPLPSELVPPADLAFFTAGSGPRSKIADGFETLNVSVKDQTRFEVKLHLSKRLGNKTRGIRLTSQVFPRN